MANIRQNLFFAFVYNAVGVAGGGRACFYPVFGLVLSPIVAGRRDGVVFGQRHRQRA